MGAGCGSRSRLPPWPRLAKLRIDKALQPLPLAYDLERLPAGRSQSEKCRGFGGWPQGSRPHQTARSQKTLSLSDLPEARSITHMSPSIQHNRNQVVEVHEAPQTSIDVPNLYSPSHFELNLPLSIIAVRFAQSDDTEPPGAPTVRAAPIEPGVRRQEKRASTVRRRLPGIQRQTA